MRLEFLRDGRVDRQQDAALGLLRRRDDRARFVGEILLAQRLADAFALGEQERVGHAAADDEDVDLVHEIFEQIELGRHFGAADDRSDGALRTAKRGLQRLELLLHRPSCVRGQLVGEPIRRRMCAMGGGEGVIDIDVAELGELVDMGRIVLLLALMEAGVLEQEHVAVLHFGDRVVGRLADAVGRESDRPLDDVGDSGGDGLERIGLVRAALGPAEMREQNDLAAFVRDFRDGRRNALDARRIGHAAVFRRNVEIDAQEHAFAGHVGVVERAERFAHVSASQAFRRQRCVQFPTVLSCPRKRAPSRVRSSGGLSRHDSGPPLSRG